MEDIGPEGVKRQRLDSAGNASVQRMQHQQYNQRTGPPTPQQQLQLHNTTFAPPTLQGSSHYAQVPPSPYDNRNLAEQQQQPPNPSPAHQQQQHHHQQPPPQQQQYGQPASGYSTPNREVRPSFPDQGVPHHLRRESGAMPGPGQAPDEASQVQNIPQHPQGPAPAMRPVNTEFGGPEYGQPYGPNPNGHPADMPGVDPAAGGPYINPDPQQQNGSYHPMPMSQPPPNGPHHPHSMSTAPPPPGHLQHAQYGGPGPGMGFDTPTTPVYAGQYIPATQQGGPKKNARAQQACENCRARKAKCDEGKPACGHCRENNTECKYKDMPPAKHERAQKEMMDKFESIKDDSQQLQNKVAALADQNAMLVEQNAQILSMLAELRGGGLVSTPQIRPASNNLNPSTPIEGPNKRPRIAGSDSVRFQTSGVQVAGVEGEPGGPVTLSHNTGAHRLLRWGRIQEMLKEVLPLQNYVMNFEEHKGVMHYYGKGQSQDRMEGLVPPAPGSPATPSATDDVATSQEVWGTDLGRPYLAEGKFFGCKDDSLGGLTLDGTLNLEWSVMNQLMGKYIEHFHLLHPFLNTAHLRHMLQRVHQQANPGTSSAQSPFLKNVMRDPPRPSKRKYSADYGDPGTPGASGRGTGRVQEQPLERRISTAIVLLVLALGKICEYSDPLPGPVPGPGSDNPIPTGTPASRMMPAPSLPIKAESPANIESPMRDAGSSIPSPMSISDRGAPTSSSTSVTAHSGATPQDGQSSRPMRPGDRNVDVVPGLAYYVRAVEILGVLHGGNEVAHAQAFILAALYCSQNGCVLESWAWLQDACRVARFHVREKYLDNETKRNPDGANIIRFVFYTALQLESDIIAELDVQSSGIAQLHSDRVSAEKEIGLPKGVVDTNNQIKLKHKSMNQIEMFYSYQLSMRTLLNDIQTYLYPTNPNDNNAVIDMRGQEHFEERIKLWRNTLTPSMIWTDDDEPSQDLNEARLRAKYYGARYIIHRPSLYHALHEMTPADWPAGMWDITGKQETDINESFVDADKSVFDLTDAQERILRSCKMCIKSAIHSTIAFDGVMFDRTGRSIKQRLIVTNIFGTAHAQFGNMLVLASVYWSYMSSLIDRTRLLSLLRRTIKFLRSLQAISTTLKHDAHLLEHVYTNIQNENKDKSNEMQVLTNGQPNHGSVMSTPTQGQATVGSSLSTSFSSVQ